MLPTLRSSARYISLILFASLISAHSTATDSENTSIDESRFVEINGIEQWITIKGSDRANPAILFVHGGPGNPLSVWSDSFYEGWEENVTIIHWDQRYAGKTYQQNEPVEELTPERFDDANLTIDILAQDGLYVSEYLLQHLEKDKLILTGTSWGSVLAVHMAKQNPDFYHAYVGVSQLVEYDRNIKSSYARVLQLATEKQDEDSLTILTQIGAPPWINPRSFGSLRRIIRKYELEATSEYHELAPSSLYKSDSYWAAYESGEELSFLKFVGFRNDGMANSIDLPARGTDFEIPFYLIQGEEDLLTLQEISKAYFDQIAAPQKDYILVPKGGHDPNKAMLQAQRTLIETQILPAIGQ